MAGHLHPKPYLARSLGLIGGVGEASVDVGPYRHNR
jgi:hypothetical protein